MGSPAVDPAEVPVPIQDLAFAVEAVLHAGLLGFEGMTHRGGVLAPRHPPGAHTVSVHRSPAGRIRGPQPPSSPVPRCGPRPPPKRPNPLFHWSRDVTDSLLPDRRATGVPNRPGAPAPTRAAVFRRRAHEPIRVRRVAATSAPGSPDPSPRVAAGTSDHCNSSVGTSFATPVAANQEASERATRATRSGHRGVTPPPCQRSAAGRATGQPAPPVADARARGANQAGTTPRQQWLGASEQPPRDGSQARQRRAPHRRQAAADRAPRRGRRQGEREGRPRPPERALAAIRTLAQRGRRGASRGGRPGSAGQTKGVVSEANGTRSASRLLMPFFD